MPSMSTDLDGHTDAVPVADHTTDPEAKRAHALETVPGLDLAQITVTDELALLHLSGLLDVVRDTSRDLLHIPRTAQGALSGLRARYQRIRQALPATLNAAGTADLLSWSPDIDHNADITVVYDAAATTARWVDILLQMPTMKVARARQASEIARLQAELDDTPARSGAGSTSGAGQYL